ncbi:MAG TPA: hypothetical protein VGR87_02220 [Candidatus Limnocylindria bacterium]|nr:hypothetical protein [Candidatus Limnocylindria bacterium]
MADWVRPLFRATGASREWHAPRIKGLTTTTYCDKILEGALEIAREDRAEREGRCATCATHLTPPMLRSAVKKAAVKKAALKRSVTKPAPKKTSIKAPVAMRSIGRSGRGRA